MTRCLHGSLLRNKVKDDDAFWSQLFAHIMNSRCTIWKMIIQASAVNFFLVMSGRSLLKVTLS